MKKHILMILLLALQTHAKIEYADIPVGEGQTIQTCIRYPDLKKFSGKRPALLFIQGSGRYDTCLRLESPWGTGIVERGVAVVGRQKRGVRVNPATAEVEITQNEFAQNDLPSLKNDSVAAFRFFQKNRLIDSQKISIVGGSEGTWMAAAIAREHPEVFELSLFSSAIERFDSLFERQLSTLFPTEFIAAFDRDKSHDLTKSELSEQDLQTHGLLPFCSVDTDGDSVITSVELASEFRRNIMTGLASGSSVFLESELGGGTSVRWLKSALVAPSLGPELLQLKMPVSLHHGRLDIHARVEPVIELQEEAARQGVKNLEFNFYDGLGHGLSKDVIYRVMFEVAERLAAAPVHGP